mmetsp:Transcript_46410/g.80033  ORF Transcript_46410/g.80033 Transcript_46410/m.80033 type:complete len:210 (-) Transcript_46410:109-738(-)|eukprot:CAMPEP_0206377540 /NCGR_PEP_ID=MMETSP0294-20121207/10226_1 /ASSEMBLY_ACC=CAM_ASM_000327 /TAXON_ID=39354 /ORGANISM="Heterosigma akashiwo, Strain CCMP2393" /LENGTH=209 /DNA_ID=CAMNT_0053826051 /DNA_START=1154 /DNA_END=1783 /DNA_ORIENTATION=+
MPATIVKDEEDEPLPKKGKFRPAEVVRGGMTFGVVLVESTWSADQPHGLRPFPGGGRKQSKSSCHCSHLALEHATETNQHENKCWESIAKWSAYEHQLSIYKEQHKLYMAVVLKEVIAKGDILDAFPKYAKDQKHVVSEEVWKLHPTAEHFKGTKKEPTHPLAANKIGKNDEIFLRRLRLVLPSCLPCGLACKPYQHVQEQKTTAVLLH